MDSEIHMGQTADCPTEQYTLEHPTGHRPSSTEGEVERRTAAGELQLAEGAFDLLLLALLVVRVRDLRLELFHLCAHLLVLSRRSGQRLHSGGVGAMGAATELRQRKSAPIVQLIGTVGRVASAERLKNASVSSEKSGHEDVQPRRHPTRPARASRV